MRIEKKKEEKDREEKDNKCVLMLAFRILQHKEQLIENFG